MKSTQKSPSVPGSGKAIEEIHSLCAPSTKLPSGLGIQVLARTHTVILCPQTGGTDGLVLYCDKSPEGSVEHLTMIKRSISHRWN